MANEIMYRCSNTGGPDGDCEYAGNEELIPESKVSQDDDGNAICPGETVFGEPCGATLEEVKPRRKIPWKLIAGVGISALILVCAVWFFLFRGSAVLRVDTTPIVLTPGESAKIELFNDGENVLKLKEVRFSADVFSVESEEQTLEVEPGENGDIRIKLSSEVSDNVEGDVTLYTNGSEKPITIKLAGNVDPWSVVDKLNKSSKILSQE